MVRLNGEHWKENLIGETLDYRLKKAIIERQCRENAQLINHINESAFVVVTDPKTRRIKDIGFNKPDDLILDNFGLFLNALMCPPISYTVAHSSAPMVDTDGVSRTVGVYYFVLNQAYEYNEISSSYTYIKFGSGSTTPARSDCNIETALGASPENGEIKISNGQYGSGRVAFGGAVIAAGSDTLSEVGFFIYCKALSALCHFMWFHDLLSTPVSFVAGDKLTGVYSVGI